MGFQNFNFSSIFPVNKEVLFDWHERKQAFKRLMAPWEEIKVIKAPESLAHNSKAIIEVSQFGVPLRWELEHYDYIYGQEFSDRQCAGMLKGPFQSWQHRHSFNDYESGKSILSEEITYSLPLNPISKYVADGFVQSKLERLFKFRHAVTRHDMLLKAKYQLETKKIIIFKSKNFIADQLSALLDVLGHQVTEINSLTELELELKDTKYDALYDFSLFNGDSPLALINTLKLDLNLPQNIVAVSCANLYQNSTESNEQATPSASDEAKHILAYEQAFDEFKDKARLVKARLGLILSLKDKVLSRLYHSFSTKLSLTGNNEHLSWLSLDDAIAALYHMLADTRVSGAVNVTAPTTVTKAEFYQTLAKITKSQLNLNQNPELESKILGDSYKFIAKDLRVKPDKLSTSNFEFRYPDLERALRHLTGN